MEVRHQLAKIRSHHSNNQQIVRLVNHRLAKLYYLQEPFGFAHEQRLVKDIDQTWRAVRQLVSESNSAARHCGLNDTFQIRLPPFGED
jgi:hypothetical protein